jgi:NTE family protein
MRIGLVLGAGGTVGLAWHAGVLRALEQVGGVVPDDADLIVGTSAGSVAAAYMRSGWSTEELWQVALGRRPVRRAAR